MSSKVLALSAVDRLLIEDACRALVLRSARAVDDADHERLAAMFTEDARLTRPGGEVLEGRQAIVSSYRHRAPDRITRHLIVSTQLDVDGADRARGLSQILLWTGTTTDEPGAFGRPASRKQVLGTFDDEFKVTTEGWQISRRQAHFALFYDPA